MRGVSVVEDVLPTELEHLLEESIPCGGVPGLGVPPCGRHATLRLDRKSMRHCKGTTPSDFKCDFCYGRWLSWILHAWSAAGGQLLCVHCGFVSTTVDGFAPYRSL